jgi:hypothetical protein
MNKFHKAVSKRIWFLLFNLGTILYLILSGVLKWDLISIFSYGLALFLMNGIAWISARKFKDWK